MLGAADLQRLFSIAQGAVGTRELRARRDSLPDPVGRYLRYAISDGAPAISTVRMKHGGTFRTKPDQRWFTIKGQQYFTAAQPGFVWNASIWPLPFLWIEARDCLLGNHGNMLVKLASVFTIADASGPEIDQGAALRWLAECAWFPYAFVGSQVEWTPIDAHSARVSLRRDGLPVSAIVEFDDEGKLASLRAERYRDVGGGTAALTRWAGTYSDYRSVDGFRVPYLVDVRWILDGQEFSYARFRITTIEYGVPKQF
jgi:uncharacterized protein DUF6544